MKLRILFSLLHVLLAVGCVESKTYEPPPPPPPLPVAPAPVLRLPPNNSYRGSVVTGALRPLFQWEPSTWTGTEQVEYQLELSTDRTFSTGVITVMTTATSHRPTENLDVSNAEPKGARYFWRVRSCIEDSCSAPTPTWWVNVGRTKRDINGDGFADIVMTAPGAGSTIPATSGRLYMYLGGSGSPFNTVKDSELSGGGVEWFRTSASIGDFNGDGFSDLAVRLTKQDSSSPRIHLYFGAKGAILDAGVDAVIDANVCASVGDVNGDGFDDLHVVPNSGAPGLVLGNANGAITIVPFLGAHVRSAGDVNGDGYADVVTANSTLGKVEVYFGGAAPFDTVADGVLSGRAADFFGTAAGAAGDINGDGFADVLVGAPGDDVNGSNTGRAYSYLGGPGASFDVNPDGVYDGDPACVNFGSDGATAAGDLNGDGYDDIAIRMMPADQSGLVHIYYGAAGTKPKTQPVARLSTTSSGSFLGKYMTAADTNGDGFDDLVVGAAHYSNETESAIGRAFLYLGASGETFNEASDGDFLDGVGTYAFYGSVAADSTELRIF